MSRYSSSCPLDCKVYVGGLTKSASREEIERTFNHYGKLRNVFVARNPPGFAFVEFYDPQDAEDAVRGLDGRVICGVRARVELSHGKSRSGGGRGGGRDADRRRRSRSNDRRRGSYSRSSSRSRGERNGNGFDRRDRDRDSRRRRSRSRS